MRNLKPEKRVEQEVMLWARKSGFDLSVVDSKAQYSPRLKMYLRRNRATNESVPDLVGNNGSLAVFIELKAKGKRNNVSFEQWLFLRRKIEAGCFACVADSSKYLEDLWYKYNILLIGVNDSRKKLLLQELPMPIEERKRNKRLGI